MTREQARIIAQSWSDKHWQERLQELTRNSELYPALVRLLETRQMEFAVAGSSQSLAPSHGVLAHNAGSVFALQCLIEEFAGIDGAAESTQ